MVNKFYIRDYDSLIFFEISYEYFCILKKTGYLSWFEHDCGIDRYEFVCDVCGKDIYIEVVSALNEKSCKPKHLPKTDTIGFAYHE